MGTLEKAYFHVNNGGVTLELCQDKQGGVYLKAEANHFGPGLSLTLPLDSKAKILWLLGALRRLDLSREPQKNALRRGVTGRVEVRAGIPVACPHTWDPNKFLEQIGGTFDGCPIITPEGNKARLEELEYQLAAQYNITENVREALRLRVKNGEIPETPLVTDWLSALSWCIDEAWDGT